jgi:hypothetical protein
MVNNDSVNLNSQKKKKLSISVFGSNGIPLLECEYSIGIELLNPALIPCKPTT